MIRSNKGMIVIKGSREYVFADFAVVVHSLKGALVESGMLVLCQDLVQVKMRFSSS